MSSRRTVRAADGHTISYLVAGEGPVVLVVPALLQSAWHWDEEGYVERIARAHRAIVIDPLGHGESDKPHDPAAYGTEVAVAHTVAVLDAEAADRATLWGYSSGAETVLDVARRRPDRVAAVIVGAMYLGDIGDAFRAAGRDLRSTTENAATALERGDWDGYFDATGVPRELREFLAAGNDPRAIGAAVRSDLQRPRGFLKPPVPTFAYWGTDDVVAHDNARLAERLPIEWVAVPGDRTAAFRRVDRVWAPVESFLDGLVTA